MLISIIASTCRFPILIELPIYIAPVTLQIIEYTPTSPLSASLAAPILGSSRAPLSPENLQTPPGFVRLDFQSSQVFWIRDARGIVKV